MEPNFGPYRFAHNVADRSADAPAHIRGSNAVPYLRTHKLATYICTNAAHHSCTNAAAHDGQLAKGHCVEQL